MDGVSAELIREYVPVADEARYTLYPATEEDVLAFHDRATVCWIVAPEPLAASDAKLELPAEKEMFADAAPAAVGANVRVNGTLWPAAKVTGKVSPLMVNAELFELAEARVMLPPLAVIVPLLDSVVPTVTLPKVMEPGVTLSIPVEVVAVPLRETATEGSDAFDVITTLAVSVPELFGENVTEKFALVPAARE